MKLEHEPPGPLPVMFTHMTELINLQSFDLWFPAPTEEGRHNFS